MSNKIYTVWIKHCSHWCVEYQGKNKEEALKEINFFLERKVLPENIGLTEQIDLPWQLLMEKK